MSAGTLWATRRSRSSLSRSAFSAAAMRRRTRSPISTAAPMSSTEAASSAWTTEISTNAILVQGCRQLPTVLRNQVGFGCREREKGDQLPARLAVAPFLVSLYDLEHLVHGLAVAPPAGIELRQLEPRLVVSRIGGELRLQLGVVRAGAREAHCGAQRLQSRIPVDVRRHPGQQLFRVVYTPVLDEPCRAIHYLDVGRGEGALDEGAQLRLRQGAEEVPERF